MRIDAKVAVATGAAALLVAAPATAAAKKTTTLRFQTANIVVTTVDLGPAGKSPGDMYVYDGDVVLNGRTVGKVYGANTSIRIDGAAETVSGQLTFELGGSDTLVVGGTSQYPADDNSGFIRDKPFTRVVFGGTGRYAGARGTITTTRISDGGYQQVVKLVR